MNRRSPSRAYLTVLVAVLATATLLTSCGEKGQSPEVSKGRKEACEEMVSSLADPLLKAVTTSDEGVRGVADPMMEFIDANAALDISRAEANDCALVKPISELGDLLIRLMGAMAKKCTSEKLDSPECMQGQNGTAIAASLIRNTLTNEADNYGTSKLPEALDGWEDLVALVP